MTRSVLFVLLTLLAPLPAQESDSRPSSRPTSRISVDDLPEPEDVFAGEPETHRMKPGEVKVFTYIPEVDGEASIWARSETLDVTLEVLDEKGKRIKFDDDWGGGTAAYLYLDVKAEAPLVVVVAAKPRVKSEGEGRPGSSVRMVIAETPVGPDIAARVAAWDEAGQAMKALRSKGELAEARKLGRAELQRGLPAAEDSPRSVSSALFFMGLEFYFARDVESAAAVWKVALDARERTLPPEHADLQRIRVNYANTVRDRGDLAGARVLQGKVLAIWERLLPDEHPELQLIRTNYAGTLQLLGNFAGACEIQERVLAAGERTLPEDDPTLQRTRNRFAVMLVSSGDLGRALALFRKVLAVYERTRPEGHPELQGIRIDYAAALSEVGELASARALQEKVLATLERTYPDDDPTLQTLRQGYGSTLFALGEVSEARSLFEKVLAVRERTLPDDHLELQQARVNYANALFALGDVKGARALQEKALQMYERSLPENHPDLQLIRHNYAITLNTLGDVAGARALERKVLAVHEKSLPADHPALLAARQNHADTLRNFGELEEARTLLESVIATQKRTLPADHPNLQRVRQSYAATLADLGDLTGARSNLEAALAVWERTLPEDHLHLQRTRRTYVQTLQRLAASGDAEASRRLEECLVTFADGLSRTASRAGRARSPREVGFFVHEAAASLAQTLSFGASDRVTRAAAGLVEELRSVAGRQRRLALAAGAARGESVAAIAKRRQDLAAARKKLTGFIADPVGFGGGSKEEALGDRLTALVRAKEAAERALIASLREIPGAEAMLRTAKLEDMAAALPEHGAGVSYCSYWHEAPGIATARELSDERLVAFVLHRGGEVTRVDLGSMASLRSEITTWRELLGAPLEERGIDDSDGEPDDALRLAGEALRKRLVDPVLEAAGPETRRLVVALADDMQVIGLDALPIDEETRVGDRVALDVVAGLSWLGRSLPFELNPPRLVTFGDVDFLGKPRSPSKTEQESWGELRGAPELEGRPVWKQDFRELPFTDVEVRAIAKSFERAFDDEEAEHPYEAPVVLRGRRADKGRFRALAPKARYLHLATHGWFAPESVPSIRDTRAEDLSIGTPRSDLREDVSGYLPLSLCGLALTGANLPPDEDGSHPGLLSGTEIAAMNLSGVELAVLSACETSVGVRRAGQGIASLQEALFSAGVRYSITSLWKVPDEATMELMTRFYEGIWRRGETKRQALWNAKLKLRRMKDSRTDKPKYGLRDWAGWVLVGNPE